MSDEQPQPRAWTKDPPQTALDWENVAWNLKQEQAAKHPAQNSVMVIAVLAAWLLIEAISPL